MKIATYNVNGVNGRLAVLLRWLAETRPDVVCLQELKADERFPEVALTEAGYSAIWHGQKSWNGVAILRRGQVPVEIRRGLPGDPEDLHSRYLEADIDGLTVACLYLLRMVLRRQVGGIGTSDILVLVLISEVAGQGFLPESRSVVDAGIVIFVILCCSYSVEWLQFKFPAFERLTREPKLKLIENGRFLRRNMRQEFVTEEELMAQVREEGLEDCREIKAAYMEADGRISFIKNRDT